MHISGVKTEQLTIGELLSASFSVWLRTIWSTAKLSLIFFIVALGTFFGALLSYAGMPQIPAIIIIVLISTLAILAFSFSVFAFTFFAEDTVNGSSPSVLESLAKVYSSIHILLAAAILVALAFMVCFLPALLFKSPLILLPTILLLFILYVIAMPFVSFFPMAVLLRGAGVIDSLKYSYYMVKGRWFKVLGWILIVGIVNMVASLIFNVTLKILFSHLLPSSASNLMASIMMGGGVYGIIFMLLCFIFVMIFISLLFYSFSISAMTIMFLNLEVINAPQEDDDPFENEANIRVSEENSSQPPHEITEMFKNIKAVDVNVATTTERRTALGRLNREEALRQFKKDDQMTFPPLNAQPVTPPAAEASSNSVVNIPEDIAPSEISAAQDNPQPAGMPTITIRQHTVKESSFPSVYKPEDTK